MATIRPRIESDLGFRVAGKVAHRKVENGQRVQKGDILALLDDTDARLQLQQAEAEQSAARVAMDQAKADARRGEQLQKAGWTPQAILEKLYAAAEEARGRAVRADRSVELALNAISYATLTAEADGVITATLVEPGQIIAAGQPAIRLARLDQKEAQVSLPETLLLTVETAKASLTLWARPERPYTVSLRELSPAADPATRTYAARFAIPDADEQVSLGMSASVTLSHANNRKAARLPLAALFNQGAGPSLWTVDANGAVTLKKVEVLAYESDSVLIGSGVEEGENVVALGVQKLDPHVRVRVVSKL